MSDHGDAPGPTGITDIYTFQKPGDSSKSIFIVNVDPQAQLPGAAFEPEASYQVLIDTNADAEAEIAYHVRFVLAADGQQLASVYRLTGEAARGFEGATNAVIRNAPASTGAETQITTENGYSFYAGPRSDPFFADFGGFQNNLQFTGADSFANLNVLGIVLEAPNSDLGPNPQVGVWARTIAPVHGKLSIVDQAGRPAINAGGFNSTEEDIHRFNETPPAQQREGFLGHFVEVVRSWGYSEGEATRIAESMLPDILPYDYNNTAGFPNGRKLEDDVVDVRISLVTHGQITSDLTGPHTDLLADFPYLGPPH